MPDEDELRRLAGVIESLREEIARMSADTQAAINELREEVTALTTSSQSAIALLDRLTDMVEEAADDPAEIRAIVADVRAQREALGAAVAANTPSEQPPAGGGNEV